ncbi:MAG: response regulator transcription factor, partial [Elusimicrobiota bacterium]
KFRILLGDSHHLFMQGMAGVINACMDTRVVDRAGSLAKLLTTAKTAQPNLIITSVFRKSGKGVQPLNLNMMKALRDQAPGIPILLVCPNEGLCHRCLFTNGHIAGCIPRDCTPRHLVDRIQKVRQGKTFKCPAHPKKLSGMLEKLTPREIEVLDQIAFGLTNREISDKLNCSVRTAEAHRANIMAKTELYSTAALTRLAITSGLSAA